MVSSTGKRVLVVEDNPILACDMEDLICDAGWEAVGPAMDLETGLDLARNNRLDAALLDIDLGGERVWPLASELLANTVPIVFVTADCRPDEMPSEYAHFHCLEKPAARATILQRVTDILAEAG